MPLTKCSILRIIDAWDTFIATTAVTSNIFDVQSQNTVFIVTVQNVRDTSFQIGILYTIRFFDRDWNKRCGGLVFC